MAEVKTPVLETKHLGISFGGLHAVQDFNIQMNAGELVGLIGPNGAGKTTVFNLLTGVYVPTEGTVLLSGVPLNGKKTHQFVEAGIARTFQNIRLFNDMTVIENVKVACTKDIHYNLLDATFRTPSSGRRSRRSRRRHWTCWRSAVSGTRRTFFPPTCPTASSGSWRSPVLWPLI